MTITCGASIRYEIDADLSDEVACTLGHGHKSPHHSVITETRVTPERTIEITTRITWT